MTLDQWKAIVRGWKPKMGVMVNVGDLTALIERMDAVETWATKNVAGDELRRILWPSRKSESPGQTNLTEDRLPVHERQK